MRFKFGTQYKRSKEGNIHFSFLSISFGKDGFLIVILGLALTIFKK